MEKTFIFLILFFLTPLLVYGQGKTETEKSLIIVPLITSSPLLGTGVGASASYLYDADSGNSSKSQLQVGGQRSDTESWTTFIKNNSYFKKNSIISTTIMTYSNINNEFPSDDVEYNGDVEYNIDTILIQELLMFKMVDNYYLGGEVTYKDLKYDPNNAAGKEFLFKNGIVDEQSGGIGLAFSYDNRKNKYYPSDAAWITTKVNSFPSWLGSEESYYSFTIDGRYYAKGFSKGDVLASQLFGQYSSEDTPDSGLPSLSGKSILRGFPAGQFKARHLTGGQSEYRYAIKNSKFRLTAFFGIANLTGGSEGVDNRSRDDNGWYTAGGVGVRYAIQAKTGVDVRLDLVTTNENEQSVYLMLNQAF